jgi:hypothetical protein
MNPLREWLLAWPDRFTHCFDAQASGVSNVFENDVP